jgi:hypothetical protein
MGKFSAQLKMLKQKMDRESRLNNNRENQYTVVATNEEGIERTFRTQGTRTFIQNYMDELREKGFTNVAIIAEY